MTVSTFKVIYKSLSLFLPLILPSLSLPPFFSPSLPQQPGLLDSIQPLLSCEQVASKFRQWRLHEQLITNFQCLVVCMTSDQLYTKFVPIMFKYITGCVSDHVTGSANFDLFSFPVLVCFASEACCQSDAVPVHQAHSQTRAETGAMCKNHWRYTCNKVSNVAALGFMLIICC